MKYIVVAVGRVYHYETLHISHPLSASLFLMVCILMVLCLGRAMVAVPIFTAFRDVDQLPEAQETRRYNTLSLIFLIYCYMVKMVKLHSSS